MKNRSPGFMFYPKDWWDFKVRRMSVAARGAYWDVLTIMWKDSKDQCSVLDNNDLLARAIGISIEQWLQLRLEIQQDSDQILEEKNGFLVSARLKKAAAEQRKYRKEQSRKGKMSAQKRLNHGSTAVEPDTQPEGKSSSSSSSSKKEKKDNILRNLETLRGEFEQFWSVYPRKVGKKAARRAFEAAKDRPAIAVILEAVKQQRRSEQWTKEQGQYIPYPATWLHNGQWDDGTDVSQCQENRAKDMLCLDAVYAPIKKNNREPAAPRPMCQAHYEAWLKAWYSTQMPEGPPLPNKSFFSHGHDGPHLTSEQERERTMEKLRSMKRPQWQQGQEEQAS